MTARTMHGRAELVRRVREGQTPRAAATALGVDIKTVKKWVLRFEAEGAAGLADRSSQPRRLNRPTTNDVCAHFAGLRRWRRSPVSSQWKSTVSISFDVGSPSKKSALFALIGKAILSAIGKAILSASPARRVIPNCSNEAGSGWRAARARGCALSEDGLFPSSRSTHFSRAYQSSESCASPGIVSDRTNFAFVPHRPVHQTWR